MNEIVGYVQKVGVNHITIFAPIESTDNFKKQEITKARVIFDDGRVINREQQKKAYAIIGDIAEYSGDPPEYMKELMKHEFLEAFGGEYFSLSSCSVSLASDFINYLINFCFTWGIPTRDTMLNRADDISAYLYTCLYHRKCCICNEKAEIHHCTGSKVGMGFNRNDINNIGRSAIALCRKHHMQAHNSERDFFEKYHVYGIKLDKCLVKQLRL